MTWFPISQSDIACDPILSEYYLSQIHRWYDTLTVDHLLDSHSSVKYVMGVLAKPFFSSFLTKGDTRFGTTSRQLLGALLEHHPQFSPTSRYSLRIVYRSHHRNGTMMSVPPTLPQTFLHSQTRTEEKEFHELS
jgi:hypothetical protein